MILLYIECLIDYTSFSYLDKTFVLIILLLFVELHSFDFYYAFSEWIILYLFYLVYVCYSRVGPTKRALSTNNWLSLFITALKKDRSFI